MQRLVAELTIFERESIGDFDLPYEITPDQLIKQLRTSQLFKGQFKQGGKLRVHATQGNTLLEPDLPLSAFGLKDGDRLTILPAEEANRLQDWTDTESPKQTRMATWIKSDDESAQSEYELDSE